MRLMGFPFPLFKIFEVLQAFSFHPEISVDTASALFSRSTPPKRSLA